MVERNKLAQEILRQFKLLGEGVPYTNEVVLANTIQTLENHVARLASDLQIADARVKRLFEERAKVLVLAQALEKYMTSLDRARLGLQISSDTLLRELKQSSIAIPKE